MVTEFYESTRVEWFTKDDGSIEEEQGQFPLMIVSHIRGAEVIITSDVLREVFVLPQPKEYLALLSPGEMAME